MKFYIWNFFYFYKNWPHICLWRKSDKNRVWGSTFEFFTIICLINCGRQCFLWVLSRGRRNRCKSKPKNSSTIDWKFPCS